MVISALYYDGNKGWTMVKRFEIETTSLAQKYNYISEHKSSKLLFASVKAAPKVKYIMKVKKEKHEGEIVLSEFIDVKGWRALGNKLSDQKLTGVAEVESAPKAEAKPANSDKLSPGDSIDFDLQGDLFE